VRRSSPSGAAGCCSTANGTSCSWSRRAKEQNRKLEGATLAELAQQAGKDPLDCILDFALSEDLDTLFVAQLLHNDDTEVGKILADPDTHISLSDAGAHLTFFCDAGFGLHLLGHWSRDLGVLDLPRRCIA
jgi:N-acyl-D-aspartate/D-glutamate deacylase